MGIAPGSLPEAAALERQVQRVLPLYRRPRAIVLASTAMVAASAALCAWTIASGPTGVSRPIAAHVPATEDLAGPDLVALDEAPIAALAADDPIGVQVDSLVGPGEPSWRGVAASTDRFGVVALWTDREIWVSRDDGRSFVQELAGPEAVTALAVGVDGRVFAARHGGRLAELTPGGATRTLPLACDQVLALDAAGVDWVAALCLHTDRADGMAAMVWLSADQGRSWRPLVAPHHGDLDNRIHVAADGSLDLLTLDSGAAGDAVGWMQHQRGHIDGRPFELLFAGEEPQPFGVGHDGTSWRLSWDRRRRGRLTPNVPEGASGPRPGPTVTVGQWDLLVASNRERTVGAGGSALFRLGADTGDRTPLPGDIERLALDGIGRALATAGGEAVRYSPRHGWRRLFVTPASRGIGHR